MALPDWQDVLFYKTNIHNVVFSAVWLRNWIILFQFIKDIGEGWEIFSRPSDEARTWSIGQRNPFGDVCLNNLISEVASYRSTMMSIKNIESFSNLIDIDRRKTA